MLPVQIVNKDQEEKGVTKEVEVAKAEVAKMAKVAKVAKVAKMLIQLPILPSLGMQRITKLITKLKMLTETKLLPKKFLIAGAPNLASQSFKKESATAKTVCTAMTSI